jgi:hypothetical protein
MIPWNKENTKKHECRHNHKHAFQTAVLGSCKDRARSLIILETKNQKPKTKTKTDPRIHTGAPHLIILRGGRVQPRQQVAVQRHHLLQRVAPQLQRRVRGHRRHDRRAVRGAPAAIDAACDCERGWRAALWIQATPNQGDKI